MDATDPAEAAANDVRAALHLPGAIRGWSPRSQVRLPRSTAERVKWLLAYADWLRQEAGSQGGQPEDRQQHQARELHGTFGRTLEDPDAGNGPPP
jgi:hypothetical protein